MYASSRHYFLLMCCLHGVWANISSPPSPVRLPMEVFGVNSTQVNNSTVEDRKMMVQRHRSLLNTYGSAAAAALEQRRGRQMEMEMQRTARVLYQVGTSESDLPICAPNAVCSKIDLYETPWIERQCRCPKSTVPLAGKHLHVTINHAKDAAVSGGRDAYHQFLEERKMAEMENGDGGQLDSADELHMKMLFRKLGVFYNQDDIVMNENDYNDFHITGSGVHRSHPYRKLYGGSEFHDTKKLRHSIHRMDAQRLGGCPNTITTEDGHTIADKTRYYKLCEPIHKLPQCRYFKDWVWTLKTSPEMNVTEQIVNCRCPKNAVTYLIRREPLQTGTLGYTYLFACSPQSRLRCQRKEPCKLFTVRKRQEFLDEVNTNPLCQCPRNHHCPSHHMDGGVILGKSYIEDNIRTYSGYCMPDERKSSHKSST